MTLKLGIIAYFGSPPPIWYTLIYMLRRTGGSLASPAGTLTPVGESLAGSSFCGSEVHTLVFPNLIRTWAISAICSNTHQPVQLSYFLEMPASKWASANLDIALVLFPKILDDNGDDDGDKGGRVDPAGQLTLRRRRISFSRRRISRPQTCPRSRSHQV